MTNFTANAFKEVVMKKRRLTENSKYFLILLLGNIFYAFSVRTFIAPYGIAAGGFTGLGLALERAFRLPMEFFVFPANISVLILGWFVLGKKTVLASVASSILYPVFLALLRYLPQLDHLTENTLLAALLGGAAAGAAIGMLMRVGASTGGTDIICLSLQKWFHLPVSVFVLIVDFIVIFSQVVISGIELVLYGVIYTAVMTLVLNKVMLLGQTQLQITIFSDAYETIRTKLLNELNLGVTMLHIQTGCQEKEQLGILCIIHPRQLYGVQREILSIDPYAFVTVTQIKEVCGRGFTTERQSLVPVSGQNQQPRT